jgi:hypothetical protein
VSTSGVPGTISRLSYTCNSCPHAQRPCRTPIREYHLWNIIVARFQRASRMRSPHPQQKVRRLILFLTKEILTMYKPNFCSECGSRIERARWRFWTSRQFCEACSPRYRKAQLFLPIIAGAGLFIIGLAAGRAARPTPPPLIVERGQLAAVTAPPTKGEAGTASTAIERDAAGSSKTEPTYGPDGTATERPTEPDETVSICGARTQKGTPCQRRVRGTGRCWQHKGMPAIIRNTVIN